MKVKAARRWLARNKWKIAEASRGIVKEPTKKMAKRYNACLFTLTRPIRMRRF